MPIPVLLNPAAGPPGRAAALRAAILADGRFAVEEVASGELAAAAARLLGAGARRIVVAGGDGSVSAAASALLRHPEAELAVLPGGTLNHLATHLRLPTDPGAALDLAARGTARPLDVGWAGERLFLNTSAVGAYVTFVRLRERLERRVPYLPATLLAGLLLFFRLPRHHVAVEVEGRARTYLTPLVFVGVGERGVPTSDGAERDSDAPHGLQLIIVHGRRRARLLALGVAAARGGPRAVALRPGVDSVIVQRCRVALGRDHVRVAVDGEVCAVPAPIDYRIDHGRLRVVAPPPAATPPRGPTS